MAKKMSKKRQLTILFKKLHYHEERLERFDRDMVKASADLKYQYYLRSQAEGTAKAAEELNDSRALEKASKKAEKATSKISELTTEYHKKKNWMQEEQNKVNEIRAEISEVEALG